MKDKMIDREIVEGFLEEANGYLPEILKGIEAYVIDRRGEQLETPYRYAHTIKGAASMLGFADLSEAASDLEDLLTELNEGQLTLGKDIAGRLQQASISVVRHLEQVTQAILGEGGGFSPRAETDILPSLNEAIDQANDKTDAETTSLATNAPDTTALTEPLFPPTFTGDLPLPASHIAGMTQLLTGNDQESFTDDLEAVKAGAGSNVKPNDGESFTDDPLQLPESVCYPITSALPLTLADELLGEDIPMPGFPGFASGAVASASGGEANVPGLLNHSTGASDAALTTQFVEGLPSQLLVSPSSIPEVAPRASAEEVNSIFTSEVSAELAEVFALEAEDHLRNMSQCLEVLENSPNSRDTLQEIRRSAHSLKGAAAMVGFQEITQLAHRMEDLLDQLYEGGRVTSPEIRQLLLTSTDTLEDLAAGRKDAPRLQLLLSELTRHLESSHPLSSPAFDAALQTDVSFDSQPLPTEITAAKAIAEPPSPVPFSAFAREDSPGDIPMPPMPLIVPLATSVGSELSTELSASVVAAPAVKEAQLVDVSVEKTSEATLLAQAASQVIRVPIERLDELVRIASEMVITRTSFEQRVSDFSRQIDELRSSSDRLRRVSSRIETQYEAAALMGGRLQLPAADSRQSGLVNSSVTFNTHGFDELEFDRYTEFHLLSRQLGEAVSDTATVGRELGNLLGDFDSFLNRQGRLYSEVQDKLMRLRMVPLKSLATRMHRAVRNTAMQLGKQVDLVLVGDETEFDKVVLEELSDALLHLLRNAVDHGIESAEVRQRRGKSAKGLIHLSAFNEGTHVVLQMYDDGGGLDPAAIRATAVRQGLLSGAEAESLTVTELQELIFLPGFSTRRQVSEVSGRGVGMDVVKTTVQKLKGTISVESEPGRGMIFTVRLPMSLAMMDALLVKAAQQQFAVPLNSVTQILRIEASMIDYIGQAPVVRVGQQILPLIWLSQLLNLGHDETQIEKHQPALIARIDGQDVALLVEQIPGGREIVVKNFGNHVRRVFGVMGATLMGDGSVVLILNLSELLGAALRENKRPVTRLLIPPPESRIVESSSGSETATQFLTKSVQTSTPSAKAASASANVITEIRPAENRTLTQPSAIAQPAEKNEPAQIANPVVAPVAVPVRQVDEAAAASLLTSGASVISGSSPLPNPSSAASASPTVNTVTVLIVDDSPSVRRVSTNLVRNAGWNPVQARDGMEALEYLNNAETIPDLVLLDIEMPRMDGYQLLTTLRSSSVWRDLPVVMVTSRAGARHRDKAMDLGATDYMVKPYQEEELLTLVRQLVKATKGVNA
jgi:chemotaxis protein histidine kinase CheA/ActR/RegA family two-component response regulator